ncbi:MAG: Uncharacterized protein CEN90_275 [Parcubacteria group bacterium Licking1014_17]|nr:MAG: Uncharacterized protein CEN90_275 [Parcubacteria group bacterium Licking1014_17]
MDGPRRFRLPSFNWRQYMPSLDQFLHFPKMLSKKERYLVVALLIVAVISFIYIPLNIYRHYTIVVPAHGGSFVEGVAGQPISINPLLAQTNDADKDIANLIYAGLMKYGENGTLAYDMAKSHVISGDGLTYTFTLKDNLVWHDGTPVTADDVIFTILTAQNPDYGSFQRINWQGVDVAKVDDKTVVFKLKNRYAQFLNNCTLGIMPRHIWESVSPSNFNLYAKNLAPIGAGPYKFNKLRRDSSGNVASVELLSFKEYYDGEPYISKVTFQFFGSENEVIKSYNENRIDAFSPSSPKIVDSVKPQNLVVTDEIKIPRYFAVFFNQNKSQALSDKSVRVALNYATDKKTILDGVLSGKGSIVDSPLISGITGIPNPTVRYDYDAEKAKAELEKADWTFPAEGNARQKEIKVTQTSGKKTTTTTETVNLSVEITTSNWPELVSVAAALKEQWEKLGVFVSIKTLSLAELQQAIKDRSYEALLFGEVLSVDPDPFSFWHSSQKKDPGLNLALYDNKNADKLLEDARETLDNDARISKYASLQNTILADAPALFLYSPYYLYIHSSRIKNIVLSPISIPPERFDNTGKWYIDTQRVFKKSEK